MEPKTLSNFFTDRAFVIPSYQRDYLWGREEVQELIDDIGEALSLGSDHYIGTFVLSKSGREGFYSVVDGQQRIATMTLLIHALLQRLSPENERLRIFYTMLFIEWQGQLKLRLSPPNDQFLGALLDGLGLPVPQTRGQRLLLKARQCIQEKAVQLSGGNQNDLLRWLDGIKALRVLEFIEDDEGRAIRLFQTVNDRGVPLTIMDKSKSLLIYHSNRFLGGVLDAWINQRFGEAFRAWDSVREQAEEEAYEVGLLNRKDFREDSVLRWHFLSFKNDKYDFNATVEYVFEVFLKQTLREIKTNHDELEQFIRRYCGDLPNFFVALRSLLERAGPNPRKTYVFLLVILSAFLLSKSAAGYGNFATDS